jgi:hypothetical protein
VAEVVTGEFSKYRSNLIDAHADMKVWLWDCGPTEPDLPDAPDPPSGKEGDPKYDLAKLKYKRQLRAYEEALLKYEKDLAEYHHFQKHFGGPIEHMQWSVDARDTLQNDQRAVKEGRQLKARWYLSSRTRGHERLKNFGLPLGMTPGHGHQAALERQLAGEKEFVKALEADPVFGQERRA